MAVQLSHWLRIPGSVRRSNHRVIAQQALDRVYPTFADRYPEWIAALFDEHFLRTRVAPLLEAAFKGDTRLTPETIAAAWVSQMGRAAAGHRQMVAAATPVAATLLQLLNEASDRRRIRKEP